MLGTNTEMQARFTNRVLNRVGVDTVEELGPNLQQLLQLASRQARAADRLREELNEARGSYGRVQLALRRMHFSSVAVPAEMRQATSEAMALFEEMQQHERAYANAWIELDRLRTRIIDVMGQAVTA